MIHQQIKDLFFSSVEHVVSDISQYAVHPDFDFQRSRKIPAQNLISFLVSQGSSSTRVEMLDFWGLDPFMPTASALNHQRAKLKPEALEAVFRHFNSSVAELPPTSLKEPHYRFLAADGSTCTFFSTPAFSSPDYYCSPGHSASGVYSMHLNAFFDLDAHTYTDALIQPVRCKNEFGAFCDIVDRHDVLEGKRNVYIGDRGHCSYNNMAHVVEQGQYFLFRTKDIHSKGLVGNFNFPDEGSFDIDVSVILVRSHSKKVLADIHKDSYIRFVDQAASFDYIEYGSYDTYELSFRIVRFPISGSTYECIVTNLPRDEFPAERIKVLYNARWGIESSFRKLKYTIGLSNFHAYKPEYIKQEIWAKLIAYNITETMINHTVLEQHRTKHEYKVNFTMAAHICRIFLRLTTEKDQYDVMSLLKKELIPIRSERQYPRLQTAHYRRPRYFIYRAA
ncbi:IS4 family transposase [Blautia schinkii]|nr:IS4 family transposase [Blautia schinkii]